MQVITVIGSGGKTTAIREYASRCRRAGQKVLIVTTTHMLAEGENLCLTGRLADIRKLLEEKGSCTAGCLPEEPGEPKRPGTGWTSDTDGGPKKAKFGPLPTELYRQACHLADVVLVEGDGSRGLPAKYPAAWEPVIPENTTQIWVVAGMSALGKTFGEACYRAEEACSCLNSLERQNSLGSANRQNSLSGRNSQNRQNRAEGRKKEGLTASGQTAINDDTVITLTHLCRLLAEGYLKPLRRRYPQIPIRILAGQTDTLYRKAAGALLERQAPEELLEKLKPEWFADRPQLVLCGAGHVAAALYRIAALLECRVTVLDDRKEFADPERFPEAENVRCVDFSQIGNFLPGEANCCYAVLTRGHRWDEACVEAVLRKPEGFAYLGMIGSREKVRRTLDSLRQKGFPEEQLARIRAPIGLALGGRRPAEIAVSIAAQLVQEQYGRSVAGEGGAGRQRPAAWLSGELQNLGKRKALSGVLAVVTGKTGSAPGEEGSMLFLEPDGTLTGTIGGGKLEYQAVSEMKAAWESQACLLGAGYTAAGRSAAVNTAVRGAAAACASGLWRREYDVSDTAAAGLGMVCGGKMEVLFLSFPWGENLYGGE